MPTSPRIDSYGGHRHYHRSLSFYVSALRRHDLAVTMMVEPPHVSHTPEDAAFYRTIPKFLMIEAQRTKHDQASDQTPRSGVEHVPLMDSAPRPVARMRIHHERRSGFRCPLLLAVLSMLACERATRTNAHETAKSSVSASLPGMPPRSHSERPQTRAERDSLLRELARRRRQWLAAEITDYVLRSAKECHCDVPVYRLRTEVRGGRIIAAFDSAGHKVHGQGATVLDVFDDADSFARGRDEVVEVKFDSVLGYPTDIIADPRVQVFDDQLRLRIKVEPLVSRRPTATPH